MGAEYISTHFPGISFPTLKQDPSILLYPSCRTQERLPFMQSHLTPFLVGDISDRDAFYAAALASIAFVERWVFEVFQSSGFTVRDRVVSIGGGTTNLPWMQLRANVLKKSIAIPKVAEAFLGAAVLAGSFLSDCSIKETIRRMTSVDQVLIPQEKTYGAWDDWYARFRIECDNRGLSSPDK